MKSQGNDPRFPVFIADEGLNFKKHVFDDPKVLGRQLIEAADGHPVDEHVAIAILPNGDFEDIRLDESYDLRGRGAEKVLVARTDRVFKFKIDDKDLEWPRACISGFVLRKLADLPENYNLWQEIPGQQDRKIADSDVINLDAKGVERFISLIDQTTEGDTLPSFDQTFLVDHGYQFEVVQEGRETAIILKSLELPEGKFNVEAADILVLLPAGYPDCAPDMFYASPHLTLANGQVPKACTVQHTFAGRVWQRWSRHNNAWRPGIDGLRTMVARIKTALAEART
ncbi:multiubiquitin domain-containing protein [Epibacterium sp. MM17-32]|uniref:multiubiquitin domain-containing protein n=1 Tax=Epibacterium sp. MM17-32 TaxID=2917734 RepID=UPI001EF58164|nr:multiubiquitin domain-containing protein [Epibacterium sp. MM17-32]MCG7630645.1 multiubiquitin domain-containing protein [Epibacterium sp. MM17-32]